MYNSLKLFDLYNIERNLSKNQLSFIFWDAIVLTAADIAQKEIFEKQITSKVTENLVPKDVFYHVFSDPPDCKIGCGGATMHTISELYNIHKENLNKMKILIINAGGYSQRLPSSSILGKIFTPFPFGSPAWHLFDAKLAMYIPFIQRMNPGYFVVSSDTIELFTIDNTSEFNVWNFCKTGFTAIAHPSSLETGTMHGVYVLDTNNENNVLFKKCIRVLQKPSIEEMKLSRAIVENADIYNGEFVFTDSCFYFDSNIGKKLKIFYELHKPLECEIDAYGDFLKCPGSTSFEDSFNNKILNSEQIENILRNIFKVLKNENLNIITLNKSEFIHIGTMKEYIINYSKESILYKSLNIQSFINSYSKTHIMNNGMSIYSYYFSESEIGNNSIIEYCKFTCPIKIGENCILNHCRNDEFNDLIVIPNNIFMHTISLSKELSNENSSLYVTLIYGINDDIKKKIEDDSSKFLNISLIDILNKIPIKVLSHNKSLWELKIFPVETSMSKSFMSSLQLVLEENLPQKKFTDKTLFISAEDALNYKNSFAMLDFRNNLIKKINLNY